MKYFQHLDDIERVNKIAARFYMSIPTGKVKELNALKEEYPQFYDDFAPWILKKACKYGCVSLVQEILERHPDLAEYDFYEVHGAMKKVTGASYDDSPESNKNYSLFYPLSIAASQGHFQICEILLNAGFKCLPKRPARVPEDLEVSHAFMDAHQKSVSMPHLSKYLILFIDSDIDEYHLFTFLHSTYNFNNELTIDISQRLFKAMLDKSKLSPTEYLSSLIERLKDTQVGYDAEVAQAVGVLPKEFVDLLDPSIFNSRTFEWCGEQISLLEACLLINHSYAAFARSSTLLIEAIRQSSQEFVDKALLNDDLMYCFSTKTTPEYVHELMFERASLPALERFSEMNACLLTPSLLNLMNANLNRKKIDEITSGAEPGVSFRKSINRAL